MPIDGFKRLYHDADRRTAPTSVAVAGGDDPTVLEAMRIAADSGWVQPILVGPEPRIRELAKSNEIDLDGFTIRHAEGAAIATEAVSLVRSGDARALMKGQIATPALMKSVLHHETGLRTGRVICQVVLMEVPRDRRRFLLADTGISVQPTLDERIDILRSTLDVAVLSGSQLPRSRSWRLQRLSRRRCPRPSRPLSWCAVTPRANSLIA